MNKYTARKVKGKKIDEHRLIFEKHLGKELRSEEVVHHIDGNKLNNEISNLMLFPTKSAHAKYHLKKGDLKLKSGNNKKRLINGKLKCCKCGELKEIDEFVGKSKAHLGVLGVCKDCRKLQRNISPV